jgi:hypothetical protein
MAQTRKPALRTVDSQAPVYQLRIELLHLKPAIWRQILVPGSIKLPKLHVVLLSTMGWEGGHLHEFMFGGTHYGVPDPHFPSDPPMLNEARVHLTKALGALKSFISMPSINGSPKSDSECQCGLPVPHAFATGAGLPPGRRPALDGAPGLVMSPVAAHHVLKRSARLLDRSPEVWAAHRASSRGRSRPANRVQWRRDRAILPRERVRRRR